MTQLTLDPQEVAKFALLAEQWWDNEGPLKTLHDINPARLSFIEQYFCLENQQVLDVGCGGGILAEAMARKNALITGLDVEQETLFAAIKHAQTQQLKITYVNALIEEFNAPLFDAITCMEMLEHVQQPQVVIDHCARLLKPGGYLFLSTINRSVKAYGSAIIAAEYLLGLLPRQTHDYQKFIKPSELATIVRKSGLEVVGISGLHYNPFSRKASLQSSVAVNYLLSCFKAS